jgi:spore photoproduct lyase
VIQHFEGRTASFEDRLRAAGKMAHAGYPLGFIVAPLVLYEGWRRDYHDLFSGLAQTLDTVATSDLTFELITHRFTTKAKNVILERFPHTLLEMDESKRRWKWGPYGYGKYVYQKEESEQLKDFISREIQDYFPNAIIEYFT